MPGSNAEMLQQELNATFPWLAQLGIGVDWFRDVAVNVTSEEELVGKLRQTPQYKVRFPGLYRADGTLRMTEAQYLAREDDYRTLLKQFGRPDYAYNDPRDFQGFFNGDIDPNELKTRFETYTRLQQSGQDVIDAFYVYAGQRIGIDDLYAATVDPMAQDKLVQEYTERTSSRSLDYQTFITRATEAGLSRVSARLTELQSSGVLQGGAISEVTKIDPTFARSIIDALYHGGGNPNDPLTRTLNLSELTSAFEYAAIGAAAKGNGLDMPTKERVAEIRAAGVDRAKAMEGYANFGQNKNYYQSVVERAGRGNFGQQNFEAAAFLGSGADQLRLQQGLEADKALGQDQGQAQITQGKQGQFQQKGLRSY